MDIIQQQLGKNSYQIIVERELLSQAGSWARKILPAAGQVFILSNTTVWPLYGPKLAASLEAAGLKTTSFQIPDGEDFKSLATLAKVYDAMAEAELERQDSLWALGGGVVGDLGGLAAATYLRGINLVQVPTTLLAQVDSSVGGKVAVNHPLGKNLIGAFYQPSLVLADLCAFKTLPQREWRAGLAEIVKYGVLAGGEIWELFQTQLPAIAARDSEASRRLVTASIAIKTRVVAQDERESGLRMILNLGHTIGHGLEAATGYKAFRHGEAVAVGLAGIARLAVRRGIFPERLCREIAEILRELGLPTAVPTQLRRTGLAQEVLAHLHHDKKMQSGQLRVVLPVEKIGRVELGTAADSEFEAVVRELCGEGKA